LLPVVAIITGEQQAFDWIRNRPTGLDLSTEGVIVVTIQSRTNVFGWLTLRTVDAPGNLGLLDHQLALQWIRENIEKFGGDAKQVTLLGHGTSGAANAMLHLTSPKGSALFSKLILMSGTIFSTYSFQLSPSNKNEPKSAVDDRNIYDPSMTIVQKLACDSSSVRFVLDCLRQKSVNDLLKAFEHVYQV
jgi:carboxylesterase type B